MDKVLVVIGIFFSILLAENSHAADYSRRLEIEKGQECNAPEYPYFDSTIQIIYDTQEIKPNGQWGYAEGRLTGYFVTPEHVATVAHIGRVNNTPESKITFRNGAGVELTYNTKDVLRLSASTTAAEYHRTGDLDLIWDNGHDGAILILPREISQKLGVTKFPPLHQGTSKQLVPGTSKVNIVGFGGPGFAERGVRRCGKMSVADMTDFSILLQPLKHGYTQPGDSGALVTTEEGEALGVLTGSGASTGKRVRGRVNFVTMFDSPNLTEFFAFAFGWQDRAAGRPAETTTPAQTPVAAAATPTTLEMRDISAWKTIVAASEGVARMIIVGVKGVSAEAEEDLGLSHKGERKFISLLSAVHTKLNQTHAGYLLTWKDESELAALQADTEALTRGKLKMGRAYLIFYGAPTRVFETYEEANVFLEKLLSIGGKAAPADLPPAIVPGTPREGAPIAAVPRSQPIAPRKPEYPSPPGPRHWPTESPTPAGTPPTPRPSAPITRPSAPAARIQPVYIASDCGPCAVWKRIIAGSDSYNPASYEERTHDVRGSDGVIYRVHWAREMESSPSPYHSFPSMFPPAGVTFSR